MNLDPRLYLFVNRVADETSFAHPLVVAYAKYGIVLFAALLVAGWWQARTAGDHRAMAAVVWGGSGALAALGVAQLIGHVVERARPYAALPGVHVLVAHTADFSFPSDHATAAGAVAAGLWLASRRLRLVGAVLALCMAFARVYVGAHYPGDVAGGLLVGAAVVVFLWPLAERVLRPVLARLDASPFAFLVSTAGAA